VAFFGASAGGAWVPALEPVDVPEIAGGFGAAGGFGGTDGRSSAVGLAFSPVLGSGFASASQVAMPP
jgi:hypothetical protein